MPDLFQDILAAMIEPCISSMYLISMYLYIIKWRPRKRTKKRKSEASLSPPWNPCSLGTAPGTGGALTDLALDLAQISAGFRRSLPHSLLTSLADLVRSMNCYYSNLIEGHDTQPVDIERALKKRLPARMPASATCSSKPRHTSPCSSGSITGPPRRPCRQSRRNL